MNSKTAIIAAALVAVLAAVAVVGAESDSSDAVATTITKETATTEATLSGDVTLGDEFTVEKGATLYIDPANLTITAKNTDIELEEGSYIALAGAFAGANVKLPVNGDIELEANGTFSINASYSDGNASFDLAISKDAYIENDGDKATFVSESKIHFDGNITAGDKTGAGSFTATADLHVRSGLEVEDLVEMPDDSLIDVSASVSGNVTSDGTANSLEVTASFDLNAKAGDEHFSVDNAKFTFKTSLTAQIPTAVGTDDDDKDVSDVISSIIGSANVEASVASIDSDVDGNQFRMSGLSLTGTVDAAKGSVAMNGTADVWMNAPGKGLSFETENATVEVGVSDDGPSITLGADATISYDQSTFTANGFKVTFVNGKKEISAESLAFDVKNVPGSDIKSVTGTIENFSLKNDATSEITATVTVATDDANATVSLKNAKLWMFSFDHYRIVSGTVSVTTDSYIYIPIDLEIKQEATVNVTGDVEVDTIVTWDMGKFGEFDEHDSGSIMTGDVYYRNTGYSQYVNNSAAAMKLDLATGGLSLVLRDWQEAFVDDEDDTVDISPDGKTAEFTGKGTDVIAKVSMKLKATVDGKDATVECNGYDSSRFYYCGMLYVDVGDSKIVSDGTLTYIADHGKVYFLPYKGADATYDFVTVDTADFAITKGTDATYTQVGSQAVITLSGDGTAYIDTKAGVKFQYSGSNSTLTISVEKMSEEGHYDIAASTYGDGMKVLVPIEKGQALYHVEEQGKNPARVSYELVSVDGKTYAQFEPWSYSEYYVDGAPEHIDAPGSDSDDDNTLLYVAVVVVVVLAILAVAHVLYHRNKKTQRSIR